MLGGRRRRRQKCSVLTAAPYPAPPSLSRKESPENLGEKSMWARHDAGAFLCSASTPWRGGGNYRKGTKLVERSGGIKRNRQRGKYWGHSRDTLPPPTVAY